MARLPCLRTWFRTRSAICLWLSNGTIQINWFESHDKVVFCPKMEAITMLLSDGNSITFKTKLIAEHGITEYVFLSLKFSKIYFFFFQRSFYKIKICSKYGSKASIKLKFQTDIFLVSSMLQCSSEFSWINICSLTTIVQQL